MPWKRLVSRQLGVEEEQKGTVNMATKKIKKTLTTKNMMTSLMKTMKILTLMQLMRVETMRKKMQYVQSVSKGSLRKTKLRPSMNLWVEVKTSRQLQRVLALAKSPCRLIKDHLRDQKRRRRNLRSSLSRKSNRLKLLSWNCKSQVRVPNENRYALIRLVWKQWTRPCNKSFWDLNSIIKSMLKKR